MAPCVNKEPSRAKQESLNCSAALYTAGRRSQRLWPTASSSDMPEERSSDTRRGFDRISGDRGCESVTQPCHVSGRDFDEARTEVLTPDVLSANELQRSNQGPDRDTCPLRQLDRDLEPASAGELSAGQRDRLRELPHGSFHDSHARQLRLVTGGVVPGSPAGVQDELVARLDPARLPALTGRERHAAVGEGPPKGFRFREDDEPTRSIVACHGRWSLSVVVGMVPARCPRRLTSNRH